MRLDENYLNFLMDYVHAYECPHFRWIAETLATVPFHWTLWLDENANAHGLDIRQAYCNRYREAKVDPYFVSILKRKIISNFSYV